LLPISALLTIIFTVALTIAPLFARDMLEFAYRAPNQQYLVRDVLSGNSYPLPDGVYDLNWSPDGHMVAVTHQSAPAELRLITYPTSTFRRVSRVTSGAVAWSPDGAYYAIASSSGGLSITQVNTGERRPYPTNTPINYGGWLSEYDSIIVISEDDVITLWNYITGDVRPLISLDGVFLYTPSVSSTQDYVQVTLKTQDDITYIYDIDITSGDIIRQMPIPNINTIPRWSDDGRYVAYTAILPDEPDRAYMTIVDVEAGEVIYITEHALNYPVLPLWSGDNRFVAYLDPSTGVNLIDVTTDARYVYDQAGENVAGFTLSPDGQYVALRVIGFNENYVVLIHIESGERDLFPVSSSSSETWRPLPR